MEELRKEWFKLSPLEKALLEKILTNHLHESLGRLEQTKIQENPARRLYWEGERQDCKALLTKILET